MHHESFQTFSCPRMLSGKEAYRYTPSLQVTMLLYPVFSGSTFSSTASISLPGRKLNLSFSSRNYFVFYPNTLDFGLSLKEDEWPLRDLSSSSSSPSSSGCSVSLNEGVV